jgi:hypothetical protein
MQPPVQAQPSPSASSFAGLLASLTSPNQPENNSHLPLWSDANLGEDVATISYESALRAHARYRLADRDDWQKTPVNNSVADDAKASDAPITPGRDWSRAQADCALPGEHHSELRRASVTVRLNKAELDQMRQRAGEAGLTISAYLRSCTFEVEALRAQVKGALAQLRAAESAGNEIGAARPSWVRTFLRRIAKTINR